MVVNNVHNWLLPEFLPVQLAYTVVVYSTSCPSLVPRPFFERPGNEATAVHDPGSGGQGCMSHGPYNMITDHSTSTCKCGKAIPVFYMFLFNTNNYTYTLTHSTKHGMYQPNCGLHKILMSFGHDEYLYQTLVRNGSTLPPASLYIIRFHSFYPWHTGNAYDHLCSDEDREMMTWVQEFK